MSFLFMYIDNGDLPCLITSKRAFGVVPYSLTPDPPPLSHSHSELKYLSRKGLAISSEGKKMLIYLQMFLYRSVSESYGVYSFEHISANRRSRYLVRQVDVSQNFSQLAIAKRITIKVSGFRVQSPFKFHPSYQQTVVTSQ